MLTLVIMLGTTTYKDLQQGSVLVRALSTHEITLREFADAVSFVQPEAAQVLATVISLNTDGERWAAQARRICAQIAANARHLS